MIDGIEFIREQFTIDVRSHFVAALQRAYGLVEACRKDNKWLNWKPGNDGLGILRKIAAEYEITNAIDRLNLPLKYEIRPNAVRNASHVELITEKSRTTINQVGFKLSLPRPAVHRALLVPSNQGRLFDNDPEFNDLNKPVYVILAHKGNGSQLESAILGIPDYNIRKWASQPFDLLREPHLVDVAPVEVITGDESWLGFNKFIEEVLENGQKEEFE